MTPDQSQTAALTPQTTPSTSAPSPVVTQPQGNQAALEDAGLARTTDAHDSALDYTLLLGRGLVDFENTLVDCLADPTRADHERWLQGVTLAQVAEEAPAMLDIARDMIWPVGRKVEVAGVGKCIVEIGGELEGSMTAERSAEGLAVGITGEVNATGGLSIPEMEWMQDFMPTLPASFGMDAVLDLEFGAELSGGFRATAGWQLPDDALDDPDYDLSLAPGLEVLVPAMETLVTSLAAPTTWTVDHAVEGSGEAGIAAGMGASAEGAAGGGAGYGSDGTNLYSHATIEGGVATGLDFGLLQLLAGPGLEDAAAKFGGRVGIRAEIPIATETDPSTARFFFSWGTATEGGSDNSWVEAGALADASALLWSILGDGGDAGQLRLEDLPDRVLVRAVEHEVQSPEVKAALLSQAETEDVNDDVFIGVDVQTDAIAKGTIRVGRPAIWTALGASETLDAAGESAEDAVLDAERQISAYFLGERYEWAGAAQLEENLDAALLSCDISECRVEVTRESDIGGEARLASGLEAELSVSSKVTTVLNLPPTDLRAYITA